MKTNLSYLSLLLLAAGCTASTAAPPPSATPPSEHSAAPQSEPPSSGKNAHHHHATAPGEHGAHEHGQPCEGMKTHAAAGDGPAMHSCPMRQPGTTVRFEQIGQVPALVVQTTGDVAALREHGQKMAAKMAECPMLNDLPQATIQAENIEGGSRLVFTPVDAAQLPKLTAALRAHAENMASGGNHCGGNHCGGGQHGTAPAAP